MATNKAVTTLNVLAVNAKLTCKDMTKKTSSERSDTTQLLYQQ
jgi:hypothetical protein